MSPLGRLILEHCSFSPYGAMFMTSDAWVAVIPDLFCINGLPHSAPRELHAYYLRLRAMSV